MRCARVPAAMAAMFMLAPIVASPSPARADILITVSKADQRISVDVDGTERYRWPVSTGRRGYSTPAGSFRPIRMEKSWYSRKYDWAPMPHAIFFYKGYAMHGTVEERRLGQAASHGCVRLSRVNATTLFALLRERGKGSARIEVIDGRLPAPLADPRLNIAEVKSSLRGESKQAVARIEPKVEVKPEPKPEPKPAAKPEDKTEAKIEPKPSAKPEIKPEIRPEAKPEPKPILKVNVASAAVLLPAARPVHVEQPLLHKAKVVAVTPHVEKTHVEKAHAEKTHAEKPQIEIVRGGPFTSVGDEAAVLRGREAWLRSLDCKYGIVR